MKIVIVGAGAVGGWYGGLLAHRGHEVHAISRSDYLVLQQSGLVMRDQNGARTVRFASASPDGAGLGLCDLIVIAAKATANPVLPALVRPLVGPRTILLTLQNGMGNVEAFHDVVPRERLVAGLCFVCINRIAPGVVANTHAGYVRMAAAEGPVHDAVSQVAAVFKSAGVDCRAEDSLEGILWKKLCWNIPFNGLAIAAGGITTDQILADPGLNARARRLMAEVRDAAALRGHIVSEQHLQGQMDVTAGMGPYRPSSLIDYLEGREVEVSGIWGEPLRRGLAAGAKMPELSQLKQEIEAKLRAR
jgi:2-dehydropantoate 2-reductase